MANLLTNQKNPVRDCELVMFPTLRAIALMWRPVLDPQQLKDVPLVRNPAMRPPTLRPAGVAAAIERGRLFRHYHRLAALVPSHQPAPKQTIAQAASSKF